MARTEPMVMADQPRSPSSSVIQPDVLLDEADSYPCAARTDPEVPSMADSIRDPEILMHEQSLRLACLERAVNCSILGVEPETPDVIIARAKAYADFVIGKSNG